MRIVISVISIIAGFWFSFLGGVGYAMDLDVPLNASPSTADLGFVWETVVNEIDQQVVMRITIPEVSVSTRDIGDSFYTVIEIPEAGNTGRTGEPMLPMIGGLYQISDRLAPEVTIRIIRSHQEKLTHSVLPCQEDQEVDDIIAVQDYRDAADSGSSWYPSQRVFVEEPVILRDIRLLPVAFYPVQYDARTNTIDIIEEAELVIHMKPAPSANILRERGPYSATWDAFYRALIPNYSCPWTQARDRNVPEHYLLIMPDLFESRCQGFIAWKEQQGFIVDVLKLSQIGTNPTAESIKQAILTQYNTENRPVYASIIGSTNTFPIHESRDQYYYGDFDDDLFYSQLSGTDLLPDIFLSRYPAVDPDELTVMLSRILYYEQTPNMTDLSYYKTGMMACSNLYASQEIVKEQTRERLETNLDYETVHTMYDWQNHSDPVSTVLSWINQGVSLINYRGEGWRDGWHPLHVSQYYIEWPEVYTLQNIRKFPVITSIGCGVAMFDGYTECFGHAWMALGTPAEPKGAVAFMGPTWNTRTTINNWIDRGIYRGFCYHNITRSGPAFNYGKIYAYTHFLGTQYMTNDIPTHMREYILFGNPDLFWRTDIPRTANVYHAWPPDAIGHGIVIIDDTGKKVANAQISFLKDNERRVYVTNSGGGCFIQMDDITEPISCTITGWNLIPVFSTFDLPPEGDDGDLVITEVKPDIQTTGTTGDKVEIANLELETTVNLKGWTIGDLDGYDVPFVEQDAFLGPQKIAVIEFVGFEGVESVEMTSYGLLIKSRSVIGLSSEEDTCILRNTIGRIRDAICWHNRTGIGSTNVSIDMSKLTQPTTSVSMGFRAWWTGPDEVTQETYELYAIDWSSFAGPGGPDSPGSIQRIGIPGSGVYDSPAYFRVAAGTNFGVYTFPAPSDLALDRFVHLK